MHTEQNSFEIGLLLSLSFERTIPSNVRKEYLRIFYSLSKSIKTNSLCSTFNETEIIQQRLFNSCIEYKSYAHFIQNDLIPIIIDYEVTNSDLISELTHIHQQKINEHALNAKTSIFAIFGWCELFLFVYLNLSFFFNASSNPINQLFIAPILLSIFCVHLFLALRTFKKRQIFCCYLQCLSAKTDEDAFKYVPYILEGFNFYDISLLHHDNNYAQRLTLINPNQIKTSIVIILSLKYIRMSLCCFFSPS